MLVDAPTCFTGPLLGFPKIGWLPVSVELHLARRYLLGLRRRTHIATVTLISMIGLGLGVLALVVTPGEHPVRDRDQGHPCQGDSG